MESIEANGKSVEDAILQGLARLKRRRDEVEIAVIQEPARGTFGIGNKEARVRVTVRPGSTGAVITPEMADALLGPEEDEEYAEEEVYEEEGDEGEFEDDEEFEDEEYEEGEEYDVDEFNALNAGQQVPPLRPEFLPAPGEFGDFGDISVATGEMQDVENPSSEDVDITVDVLRHILQYMNIRAIVRCARPIL